MTKTVFWYSSAEQRERTLPSRNHRFQRNQDEVTHDEPAFTKQPGAGCLFADPHGNRVDGGGVLVEVRFDSVCGGIVHRQRNHADS